MTRIEIGKLLSSDITGFVAGCRVNQIDAPAFGAMTLVPLDDGTHIYGLIYDIHIDDDGLVRQLAMAEDLADDFRRDNRENRTVPVEIGVLALGYTLDGQVSHLLPPRPPLSLDEIFLCTPEEIAAFTSAGRMGYLRHVLRDQDKPVEELLAAHLKQVREVQEAAGNPAWFEAALEEVITLLKDDYSALMRVLGAVDELEQVPDRQSNLTGRLG
jgi:hypothetical protein